MRRAAFVGIGLIVGATFAWLRAPARRPSVAPAQVDVAPSRPAASRSSAGFRSHATVPQRDLAPSHAHYDPVARLREEPDVTVKEIFEGEPRDPVFAPVLERRVQAALDTITRELALDDKILDVHVECRTLSCYTSIQVPRADLEEVYGQVNGILLGDAQMPGMSTAMDPELGEVTIYNAYRPATRDDAYYQRFVEEAIRGPLELSKQRSAQRTSAAPDGAGAEHPGAQP